MTILWFDTETSGLVKNETLPLDQQPYIIELGAILTDNDGGIITEYGQLIDPPIEVLDADITKITGLTREALRGQPVFADVLPGLMDLFFRADVLAAHNLPFDLSMLVFELRRVEYEHRFPYPRHWLDTVPLSGGMSLADWGKKSLGADCQTQRHRALEDVRLMLSCWKITQ